MIHINPARAGDFCQIFATKKDYSILTEDLDEVCKFKFFKIFSEDTFWGMDRYVHLELYKFIEIHLFFFFDPIFFFFNKKKHRQF
jgi:hypothetical protein